MRINISRSKITEKELKCANVESVGASYTHITSLTGGIGKSTKKVVAYHSMLTSLEGFEDTNGVEQAYLGFNRISKFRLQDKDIKQIKVLDLAGNPLISLENCPPCETLIVSGTLIKNLVG